MPVDFGPFERGGQEWDEVRIRVAVYPHCGPERTRDTNDQQEEERPKNVHVRLPFQAASFVPRTRVTHRRLRFCA